MTLYGSVEEETRSKQGVAGGDGDEREVDWTQRNSYAPTTLPVLSSDSLSNLVFGVRPS